jgi:hypothetical protein
LEVTVNLLPRTFAFSVLLATSAVAAACSSTSGGATTGDDQNATGACTVFSEREGYLTSSDAGVSFHTN